MLALSLALDKRTHLSPVRETLATLAETDFIQSFANHPA